MLKPTDIIAVIKAHPEILPHLSAQSKIHAFGEGPYFKAIERDPKEPGAKVKMKYEKKLADLIKRIFDRQKESITPQLQAAFYASKAADDYDLDWTEDEEAEVVGLVTNIYGDGIDLFQQTIFDGLADEFVNVAAKELARKYAYDFIKVTGRELDNTTRKAIQNAIASFTEPGVNLGDVMAMLPFDEDRAMRIAVTEITRVYATANLQAGLEMQKEFPDLTIIKTWYTNNDEKSAACEICGPLHMKTVKIDDSWGDVDNPPGHPNCRCWTDYGTTLGGKVDYYAG